MGWAAAIEVVLWVLVICSYPCPFNLAQIQKGFRSLFEVFLFLPLLPQLVFQSKVQ